MRESLVCLLAVGAIHAAVVRGTVVEHSSGKPLARTLVALAPLPGTQATQQSIRTNTWGVFEFHSVPAGAYLVTASRRGFPTVQYGQKNWRAAGAPVILEAEQSTFLTIRMPRYGGITGMVVDENDVGLPEHEVVAYRNTRPPQLVARAQADDRGIFRIPGLDPGRYLVRTVGRQYEDGGYLPTFYHETARVEEAAFLDVDLDRDTIEAKVRPFPGLLHTISGLASSPAGGPITIVLASDVGRETITTEGGFNFPNKPPGPYEIWASTPTGYGAYVPFTLADRNMQPPVPLFPMASVFFNFKGPQGQTIDASTVKVQIRRVDLAGVSPPENQRINNGRGGVIQGHWQFQIVPNETYVAMDFRGCSGERPPGGRADGWNDVVVTHNCMVSYTLSSKPSAIHGIVTAGAREPVPGAPVFLEAWDPIGRKRLMEPRTVRADAQGQYQFVGLAPGTYRLVSTFEYRSPEAEDIDIMTPLTVVVEEGRDQQQDLSLYIIR
jgi:hypothetical protein